MFESIAYIVLGFATAFLSLEAAWHFTACKVPDLNNGRINRTQFLILQINTLIVWH
ncbi:MAG: hypothetical protein WA667_13330 [Candidatus Nitrosopolaris sp.]